MELKEILWLSPQWEAERVLLQRKHVVEMVVALIRNKDDGRRALVCEPVIDAIPATPYAPRQRSIALDPPQDWPDSPEAWAEYASKQIADDLGRVLAAELEEAAQRIADEVMITLLCGIQRRKAQEQGRSLAETENDIQEKLKEWAEQTGKQVSEDAEKRLGARDGRSSVYTFDHLAAHLAHVYPIVKAAKEVVRDERRSKHALRRQNWFQEVKRRFPYMPDDLLYRLGPSEEWPEALADQMEKYDGEEARPYDIALEWAARLSCWIYSHHALPLRQLKTHLSKEKRANAARTKGAAVTKKRKNE